MNGQPTGTTKAVRVQAVVATAVWKKGPQLDPDLAGATTYTDLW